MAADSPTLLSRHLRRVLDATAGPAGDAQLLERFRADRDPAAVEALVRRHGPLVLAACRKVLSDDADIDDAFQATVLLLLKNAAAIRDGRALGGWLYGVAHRVAVRLRQKADRRRDVERKAPPPGEASAPDLSWREAVGVLHEELDRLPDGLRRPLLLCYLEGHSRDEAAKLLGVSEGAVKGRLERGRQLLHRRLLKRGITLSAGVLAVVGGSTAAHGVPPALVSATVTAATGTPSAAVAALVAGASPTMFTTTRLLAGAIVAVGLLTGLAAFRAAAHPAAKPADPPRPPAADNTGTAAKTVTVAGRVIDPTGKPVAGAKLYVPKTITWMGNDRPIPVEEKAVTDSDGRFRFESARMVTGPSTAWAVAARADGYAGDWAELRDGIGDITLKLVPDEPVAGRLVDLEGKPRANCQVTVQRVLTTPDGDLGPMFQTYAVEPAFAVQRATKALQPVELLGVPRTVTTDADGRFRITGVGRGRLLALKLAGDDVAKASLYVVCQSGVELKPGTPPGPIVRAAPKLFGPTFSYTAAPARVITGTVRDQATGRPIRGAWVNANVLGAYWEDNVRVETDGQGRFRLTGLPKAPTIRLGFGADTGYLPTYRNVADVEGLGPIAVDVQLVRGVEVTGRLLDPDGKPVAGHLSYVPLAANKHATKTDAGSFLGQGHSVGPDGRFRLTAMPGPGVILAQASEAKRYPQAMIAEADRKYTFTQAQVGNNDSFAGAGNAIIPLLGFNAYRIIDPAADAKSVTATIQLTAGKTVAGDVRGPDGQPLAGVKVVGLSSLRQEPTDLTGSTFEATALTPGRPRTLVFIHAAKKLGGTLTLRGDETGRPAVTLQPLATLTGRAVDIDGQPLARAEVRLFYFDPAANGFDNPLVRRSDAPRTDADGRFRVEGVLPEMAFSVAFVKGGAFHTVGDRPVPYTAAAGGTKSVGELTTRKVER